MPHTQFGLLNYIIQLLDFSRYFYRCTRLCDVRCRPRTLSSIRILHSFIFQLLITFGGCLGTPIVLVSDVGHSQLHGEWFNGGKCVVHKQKKKTEREWNVTFCDKLLSASNLSRAINKCYTIMVGALRCGDAISSRVNLHAILKWFFVVMHTRACNRAHHHNIACEVWQPVTDMSCHNVTVDDERVQPFCGLSCAARAHYPIEETCCRTRCFYVNQFRLTEASNGQKTVMITLVTATVVC